MENIYWYICVGIIGIASAIIAIYKSRNIYKISTLIAFYLFISGIAWIGEFIVLGFFNAYAYKTGVVTDTWAQNLLGHLILNAEVYPSAAIITVTSKRRKLTVFFFMILLTLIDYAFINLGLYEHHWWRYYMTSVTVVILLIIALKWFDRIEKGCKGYWRAVSYFFIALFVIHIPAPILLLLSKQHYQLNMINHLYGNLYLSSIIFIFIYHLLESIELVLITCILKKWYLKIIPFIISITFQWLFAACNILILDNNWNIFYTLVLYELFIAVFMLIERYTLRSNVIGRPFRQMR